MKERTATREMKFRAWSTELKKWCYELSLSGTGYSIKRLIKNSNKMGNDKLDWNEFSGVDHLRWEEK